MVDKAKNEKTLQELRKACNEAEKLYEQVYAMEQVIKTRIDELRIIALDADFEIDEYSDENEEQEQEYFALASDIEYFHSCVVGRFKR